MRVSNIGQYLGGASNVAAREVIRGEQLVYRGTVSRDGTALDIADFTISATAEFYTAGVTIRGSGNSASATIDSLVASTKADATLTVTKEVDTSTGQFSVVIPADLADDADTANIDADQGVLLAVVYIEYNDGATVPTIRKSRLVVIVRHAA